MDGYLDPHTIMIMLGWALIAAPIFWLYLIHFGALK